MYSIVDLFEELNNSKITVLAEPDKSVWKSMRPSFRWGWDCRLVFIGGETPEGTVLFFWRFVPCNGAGVRLNSALVPVSIHAIAVALRTANHFHIHMLIRIKICKLITIRLMHLILCYWSSRKAIAIETFTHECSKWVVIVRSARDMFQSQQYP